MIIECTAPGRARIQLTDINFVKGKPVAVTMVRGDRMDLAETDVVVQSRFHGSIHQMEQAGNLKVVTEPQRSLFPSAPTT